MKQLKTMAAKCLLGAIAALALPSCLQNETTIHLNKDGSGTVVEETMLGAKMMEMMTQFSQPGGPDPVAEMFSEDKAKAKLPNMGEGVEFVKSEIIEKDGRKGGRVTYKFADINKLIVNPTGGLDSLNQQPGQEPEKADEKDNVRFNYADGKLRIITPPADFNDMDMPEQGGAENAEMEAMMKEMMADMRITLKLKIADGIAETNATHVEGDTLTLYDVQVGKMFAQKDELKKIGETGKTDMEAAKAAFAKLDGVKVEMKDDVSVTVK